MKIIRAGIAYTVLTLPCYALTLYGAKPDQSTWKLSQSTPLECSLVHSIPYFGQASFNAQASKKINLNFMLNMNFATGRTENVSLIAMPAPWMPGSGANQIAQIKFYQQFEGNVTGQDAWDMLSQLAQGYFPTFSYQSWRTKNKLIQVSLSPVAFKAPFDEFRRCVAKLFPFSFEDIAFTTLQYNEKGELLNESSKQKLAQISDYLKHNPHIEQVVIASYTDSRGTQQENLAQAKARGEKLEQYFISLGLAKERIELKAYGEKNQIAVNDTIKGRGQNRRVVITLARDVF